MSGELDIRGAGAIVVDTETLRSTARGFVALSNELADIARLVGSAQTTLFAEPVGRDAASAAYLLYRRLTEIDEAASAVAQRLDAAAAVYEMAELDAAHELALLSGDAAAAALIDQRRAELAAAYPAATWDAWFARFEYNAMWPSELVRQGTAMWEPLGIEAGILGGLLPYAAARTLAVLGKGTVERGVRLNGDPVDVRVWPVAASGSGAGAPVAPPNLAGAAARIPSPGDGEARVRVEKYTMPDGSQQFAVYIAGSNAAPDPDELFSIAAAVDLELGNRTGSYDATLAALQDAGAQPGDVVHAFGHSQGGAIAGHLALEGGFEVKTLVSLGSPIEVDVGQATLSVALRHTDDPIAMATAGGFHHPVGAPGSFVAQRVADPDTGMYDLTIPAHGVAAYTETAGMLDASTDPRMAPVRELFDELGEAVSLEVTEYAAERG